MGKLRLLVMSVMIFLSAVNDCVAMETDAEEEETEIVKVEPKEVGTGGGMKITITGKYFAKRQTGFEEGEVYFGNEVTLATPDGSANVPCQVFKEDTNRKMIVCLPPQRTLVDKTTYCVRLKVDGNPMKKKKYPNRDPNDPANCFTAKAIFTPTVSVLEPASLHPAPGEAELRICGEIFTSLYGSDRPVAENGRLEKILRIYAPGECDLRDMSVNSPENFYELWVEEDSNYGCMVCKPKGTFVGRTNVTYLLEEPLGLSVTAPDLLKVSWDGLIYMLEYYATVTGLSFHSGSTEGGAVLRVYGEHFELGAEPGTASDTNYDPAKIFVGETECEIIDSQKNDWFDCIVAPQPDPASWPDNYAGGRGGDLEKWPDGTHATAGDVYNADPSSDIEHLDELKFCGLDLIDQQLRVRVLFRASKTGEYRFGVKAKYYAKLYLDGEPQCESWGGPCEGSATYSLDEDQMYLLTIVSMGPSSNPGAVGSDTDPCGEAWVKFYDEEKFTSVWTGNAIPETQILRVRSTQEQEVLDISFTPGPVQDYVAEVQRVCINGESEFIIGMFDTYTDTVYTYDHDHLQYELNELAFLDRAIDNIIVEEDDTDSNCFFVTIDSPRGNFPDLQVIGVGDISVTEVVAGVPDNNWISFFVGNRPSIPIPAQNLNAPKVEAAINSMFETKCPRRLRTGVLFESYEGVQGDYYPGKLVNTIEPFCDKQVNRNPWRVFPFLRDTTDPKTEPIPLRPYSSFHACFAYSRLENARLDFKYSTEGGYQLWHGINVEPIQTQSEQNIWNYACVSLKETIGVGNLIEARLRGVYEKEWFLDALSFGPRAVFEASDEQPNISGMRLLPASLNPNAIGSIDHADVIYNADTDSYRVTLWPLNCWHDFDLFELLNSEEPNPNDDPDYGLTRLSQGAVEMTINRIGWASPPVQGEIKIEHLQMKTSMINISWSDDQIRRVMEGIPTTGRLKVERTSSSTGSTCANTDIRFTFMTNPGKQSLFMILEDDVHLTPESATAQIVRFVEGHLRYQPIPPDHLFKVHDTPQVQVYINNVLSKCVGDCSFQWTADSTPTLSSLDQDQGNDGLPLTIFGDNFSETPDENTVLIGGVPCVVAESSTTEINCTVGDGAGSNREVVVHVARKGRASGNLQFSYIWEVTGVSPDSGSFGGGLDLAVQGISLAEDAEVYVDNQLCPTINWSPGEILCKVPPAPYQDDDLPVDVEVRYSTETGLETEVSPSQFTYSAAKTGLITDVSAPDHLSFQGGDEIVLTYNQLGTSAVLWIGGTAIEPSDWSPDGGQIAATFYTPPNLTAGPVTLSLDIFDTDQLGYAVLFDTGVLPSSEVALRVTDISPLSGSIYGGTIIDFYGDGFGTDPTAIEVTVKGYQCHVLDDVTSSHFRCQLEQMGEVVVVTNMGDGKYGPYHSWTESTVSIETGDSVEWQWEFLEFTDSQIGIYQTLTRESQEPLEDGISSGSSTAEGPFRAQFNVPGEYILWSGFMDEHQIMSDYCSVEVTQRPSSLGAIVVTFNGQEPIYDIGSEGDPGRRKRGIPLDTCVPFELDMAACSNPGLIPEDLTRPNFELSDCTPTVTDLTYTPADPNNMRGITTQTELTFTGTGLPTTACVIEVTLGQGDDACACPVIGTAILPSSDKTTFTCVPEDACAEQAGVLKKVSVYINNAGNADIHLPHFKTFVALVPIITSISPNSGSAAGGTAVTFRGTGLLEIDSIIFNTAEAWSLCNIISDKQVECTSPKSRTGVVKLSKGGLQALCKDPGNVQCEFTYDQALTPQLISVNPPSVSTSDPSTVTITGTQFGSVAEDITVSVAGLPCSGVTIDSAQGPETTISCTLTGLPAGQNNIVEVTIKGKGLAQPIKRITGTPDLNVPTPAAGSVNGGTVLMVTGHGFYTDGSTRVSIGNSPCVLIEDEEVTLSKCMCETPAHSQGPAELVVTVGVDSGIITFPAVDFTYSLDATPVVHENLVSPAAATAGDELTIPGEHFGSDQDKVEVGGVPCTIVPGGVSDTEVTCILGHHASGPVEGFVYVAGLGKSNTFTITYLMEVTGADSDTGEAKGNQLLTLTGKGFSSDASVTVCGKVCEVLQEESSSNTLVCLTPPGTVGDVCTITVTDGISTDSLIDAYTLLANQVPVISSVLPPRGGTAGGTLIAIGGSGFGEDIDAVNVTVGDTECDVQTVEDTEVTCITNSNGQSVETKVLVTRNRERSVEETEGDSSYFFIDAWSSAATWGGDPNQIPKDGDYVVVKKGQVLLLDVDTPVLSMLLIKGGTLIFDESKESLTLNSHIILLTEGGRLQIGSEEKPYENRATLQLHGSSRSPEIPIFGAKVLGVLEGELSMHGKHIPYTWTYLKEPAFAGSDEIRLEATHATNWEPGDEIAIATTGDYRSQSQNEKRTIKSKSIVDDVAILELEEPLDHNHSAEDETHTRPDGTNWVIPIRAEVALLSRSVLVKGTDSGQWTDEVAEKCDRTFEAGQFQRQSCFQGRWGEEIGSDEFGATIMVHNMEENLQSARLKIEHVEVNNAGQAFRLGRYPIHFHINGDMSQSYVRGASIHKSFNRAINIHASHNVHIERCVIYDIMGGAYFMEDGIETGNYFQYNLAIFVKPSMTLLSDDQTPAAFWLTNPNNTIQHNNAAGGTHIAFWFRLFKNPTGPSFTEEYCPQNVPVLKFFNNTGHSLGRFGLWTFEEYDPQIDGNCRPSVGTVQPAVFERSIFWNNDINWEFVVGSALQGVDSFLAQGSTANFRGLLLKNIPKRSEDKFYGMTNSIFLGHFTSDTLKQPPQGVNGVTTRGVILPFGEGGRFQNNKFLNFDVEGTSGFYWTSIPGTCSDQCGGYPIELIDNYFDPHTVLYKGKFRWEHEAIVEYTEGDSTIKILPSSGTFLPSCSVYPDFDSSTIQAYSCPSTMRFHTMALRVTSPESLLGHDILIRTEDPYGEVVGPYRSKRVRSKYKPGHQFTLYDGQTFLIEWINGEHIQNITLEAEFTDFQVGDFVIIGMHATKKPDKFSFDGGRNILPDVEDETQLESHGQWFYNGSYVFFRISLPDESRRKRAAMTSYPDDIQISLTLYSCWFKDCVPPPPEDEMEPAVERDGNFTYWDEILWEQDPDNDQGFISSLPEEPADEPEGEPGRRKRGTPNIITYGSDVTIAKDDYVVLRYSDSLPAKLGTLLLFGTLEVTDKDYDLADEDFKLTLDFLIIRGGRLIIGWEDSPFEGTMEITLIGSVNSPVYEDSRYKEPNIGAKTIAVFGGLDAHGRNHGYSWVYLTRTANPGDITLYVSMDVSDWPEDGSIILTSTSYTAAETEELQISSITRDTVTLVQPLKYKHIATKETVTMNGQSKEIGFAAAVGLLTRNIKFIGSEDDADNIFGGWMLVSVSQDLATRKFNTGFARLSNVEFQNFGQEGLISVGNAHFQLVFDSVGDYRDSKPSGVQSCSFVNGFNTAIGLFGANGIEIYDNVVYKTVGNSMVDQSSRTKWYENLVSNLQSSASYNGRNERFNFIPEAAFDTFKATNTDMMGNCVAASERAGYHLHPMITASCSASTPQYNEETANTVMSSQMGVVLWPGDKISDNGCNIVSGYKMWKIFDYAVYLNNKNNEKVSGIVTADSGVDVMVYVMGPSALSHTVEHKTVELWNSAIIGYTSSMDCSENPRPTGTYMSLMSQCAAIKGHGGEKFGVIFPQFTGNNKAPEKPCAGTMTYSNIGGSMIITGVTFKNFGLPRRNCPASFPTATSTGNEDEQHLIITSDIIMDEVDMNYESYYNRPNDGKINPSDCVDMHCDAQKKALIRDTDGTFLRMGVPATVVPDSAYEYNGDPALGLGDFRIPKPMLTTLEGDRIQYEDARDYPGIAGTQECQSIYHTYPDGEDWALYKCPNTDYEKLVIESLDDDTETRRLSPIAIRVTDDEDGEEEKYLDLINGMQDHGWCSGYTCLKRISTFFAIVQRDKTAEIWLTGSNPDKMRFLLLAPRSDSCVVLCIFYTQPFRMDAFADDGMERVYPKNRRETASGRFLLENDLSKDYRPKCSDSNDVSGANYIDRDRNLLYILIRGSDMIRVTRSKVVIVSFSLPFMSPEEFFDEENIVTAIAAILDIPLTKLRIVTVVREQPSTGGRRKRETGSGTTVQIEIGDPPATTAEETSTEPVTTIADTMMMACQDSSIVAALGVGAVNCTEVIIDETVYNPVAPKNVQFSQELAPQHEGVVFATQPKLRAYDSNDEVIDDLGIKENPWQITATLRGGTGHASAVLSGTTTIASTNGWFNFTDLAISHAGSGYIIDFAITYPASAAALNLAVSSAAFDVDGVPMTAGLYAITSDITQDTEFSFTLDLRDKTTDETIEDITWRGHTFDIDCGLLYTEGITISGNLTKIFDETTGRTQFDGISVSGFGPLYLECNIVSTPAEFNFTFHQIIYVLGLSQVGNPRSTSQIIILRFIEDFTTTLPTEAKVAQLEQIVLQEIGVTHPDCIIVDSSITEGSILITFTVEGVLENVTALNQDLCTFIEEGQGFTLGTTTLTLDKYMTVDGQDYYGASCRRSESKEGLHPGYIALIAVLATLLLVVVVLLLLWKLHVIPKTKTHDNGKTVYLGGAKTNVFREPTLDSARGDGSAPLNTLYSSHVEVDLRNSPTPPGQKTLYSEPTFTQSPRLPQNSRSLTPTGH